jgi:hypothetical protein
MKAISSVATLPSVDEETTTATTAELSSSDFDSISNSAAADSNTITTSNKSSAGGSGSRRKLVYSQVTTSAHNSKADITTTACTTTNTNNSNPSNNNGSSSNNNGNSSSGEEVTSSLLRNMMGAYTNRDPYLDYISLGIIGRGSMGSVERVIKKYTTTSTTRRSSNSSGGVNGDAAENNNYDGKQSQQQQHYKPIQISFDNSRRGQEYKNENINIFAAKMILKNLFGRRGKKEMILSKLSSLLHYHPVLLSTNLRLWQQHSSMVLVVIVLLVDMVMVMHNIMIRSIYFDDKIQQSTNDRIYSAIPYLYCM